MFPRRTLAIAAAGAIAFTGLGIANASLTLSWSAVGGGVQPTSPVYAMAVSANDDTLYVGGSFTSVLQESGASMPAGMIAQWRASDDTWLPMGKGIRSTSGPTVSAVAAGSANMVYVGGDFDFVTQRTDDTVASKFVARWRSTDDTWLPMGGGLSTCTGPCRAATLAPASNDDTVYVGGNFTQALQRTGETIPVNRIAQWRSADDTWLPMGKGVSTSGATPVKSIAVAPGDDTVYVGGEFTFATQPTDDTIAAGQIAQWRASDDTWLPMGGRGLLKSTGAPDAYVNDIEVVGNLVYVVGKFGYACNAIGTGACNSAANGEVLANGVAVYNASTGMWSAVGTASPPWTFLPIKSIVALPGGQLLVMTEARGGLAPNASLYLWDGASWSEAARLTGTLGITPQALATDDTDVYAGGLFSSIGPPGGPASSLSNIARSVPGVAPNPDPTPSPVYPPDAPIDVTAAAGVQEASVSWKAPAYVGSFPITDYQVVSSPGAKSCLVKAPALSCTVSGLTAGTSYTFTARALNGAGWGVYSSPSNAVTPTAPVRPSIVITGSRDAADSGRIQVSGTSTGLVGERVTPFVRFPGQPSASEGSGVQTVAADGTFAWGRKTGKKTYVYFQHGTTRSNTVTIAAR